MSDVVLYRNFALQRPSILRAVAFRTDAPTRNRAVEEQTGIGVTLIVELGVQRSKTEFYLCFHHAFQRKDRHAEWVSFGRSGGDGIQNALEAVNRHMRIELSGGDDEFTRRENVYTVRAARLWCEVKQSALDSR